MSVQSDAYTDGVRIRVHDHGGDGPALLLVHATGFHGRVWDPFVPALRERFRVVSFDQRGHGESDKPEADYEWQLFGRDTLAVVDHLGLEHPAAIGHSAGAAALVFAESDRPGTFSKLALMDPVTPPKSIREYMGSDENPMADGTLRRRRIWDSPDQMVERLKTGTPLSGWREDFLRAYVDYGTRPLPDGTIELKCPPEIEARIYRMGGRHDGYERLSSLLCPVLFLIGEHSQIWGGPFGTVPDLANGRVEVIAGAGHFLPFERPDEALASVLAFLH